jgi:hypothetical protein
MAPSARSTPRSDHWRSQISRPSPEAARSSVAVRAVDEPGVVLLPGPSSGSAPTCRPDGLSLHQDHLRRRVPVGPMLKPIARRPPTPVRSRRPDPPHLRHARYEPVKSDPRCRDWPLHARHLVSGWMNSDPTQTAANPKTMTASPLMHRSSRSLPGMPSRCGRRGGAS